LQRKKQDILIKRKFVQGKTCENSDENTVIAMIDMVGIKTDPAKDGRMRELDIFLLAFDI